MVLQRTSRLIVAAVFALVAALYVFDLSNTPVYFGGDEVHFAVGGYSLATTARNLNGDFLPVFINLADPLDAKQQPWGDSWYQPLLFYVTAAAVRILPFTVAVVRLPMAIVGGLVTPLLIYVVARRLIGSTLPAVIAAMIVALAPTHLILSRQALDYVLPLPFVIGWVWCLHAFMQSKRPNYLAFAGLLLGVGCYSYIASWALMPVFLLITWTLAFRAGASLRSIVISGVAFALPVSLGLAWVIAHPEMLAQTATRYSVTEGEHRGFWPTYISMMDPIVLFVRGGPSLVTSTARSGFVLAPVALLLTAGVIEVWRRRDWIATVIVAGLILAPVPAAFKGEPSMIQRAMYLLPFLGLLGGLGFAWLWRWSRLTRVAAMLVMALASLQFGYFYFDYFTHYKLRSAFYYDPAAFRDVADYLLQSPDAPAYYFTNDVDDVSVKWRFYTTVGGRESLLSRTKYVEPDDQPLAPPRSLLVTYDAAARLAMLQKAGWQIEKLIYDVDSRPAAVILRKTP